MEKFPCRNDHLASCPMYAKLMASPKEGELMIDESPDEVSDFESDSEKEEEIEVTCTTTTVTETKSPSKKRKAASPAYHRMQLRPGAGSRKAVKSKPDPTVAVKSKPPKQTAVKSKPLEVPSPRIEITPSPLEEPKRPKKTSILVLGTPSPQPIPPPPPAISESMKVCTYEVYEPMTPLSYICANPDCTTFNPTRLIPKNSPHIRKQRVLLPGTKALTVMTYCSEFCFKSTLYYETPMVHH